jgi:hypothetical protein
MKTDELIANLVGQLTPIQPLYSPVRRLSVWATISLATVVVAVLVFGPRPDIAHRMTQVDFTWTLASAGIVATLSSVAALILAVPGVEGSVVLRTSALVLTSAWGIGLGTMAVTDGSALATDTHWPACFLRVVMVSLVPVAALGLMIRRAAALRPALAGLMAALAASAAATIAIQIACPVDAAGHGLAGHLGPVLTMAVIGAVVGPRWLART